MAKDNMKYQKSRLWQHAFEESDSRYDKDEQEFWKVAYKKMRKNVKHLLSRIPVDMNEYTVHDISHIDSLWTIAGKIIVDDFRLNPTEAFVFGASALLHDAGMSTFAYKNGLTELMETTEFKDQLALECKNCGEDFNNPSAETIKRVVPKALRRLHAIQAEKLATLSWSSNDGHKNYLIDDIDIRTVYGKVIGRIAKSHGYSLEFIENEIRPKLNSWPDIPSSSVDTHKIACLLRVSDALHIDCKRAPRFLHAILDLETESNLHFNFQTRMSEFDIENDSVVFRSGIAFEKEVTDAWWLAYNSIKFIDQELREVTEFLENQGKNIFKVNSVKGIKSPELLAEYIETEAWDPVDIKFSVSDIESVIERFGGPNLYGDDKSVALRELIQNSADAIQARLIIEKSNKKIEEFGCIKIGLKKEGEDTILFVEDNGVGMSKRVLGGAFLDFGKSLWQSNEVMDELPNLLASGIKPIGKFGIGFFSVFMLGSQVKVYSRRFNVASNKVLLLEFKHGLAEKPVLSSVNFEKLLMGGGTRIEVILKNAPNSSDGLLVKNRDSKSILSLEQMVGSIAPCLSIKIELEDFESTSKLSSKWLDLSPINFLKKISAVEKKESTRFFPPEMYSDYPEEIYNELLQPLIGEDGEIYGRALIETRISQNYVGYITSHGISVQSASNILGVLCGEINTLDRKAGNLTVPKKVLSKWATKQAKLISTHINHGLTQANTAEIVMQCGGEIGNLKIVQVKSKWYSQNEFVNFLKKRKSIRIIPKGFLKFHDNDWIYQDEYDQIFEPDKNIIHISDVKSNLVDFVYKPISDSGDGDWESEIDTYLGKKIFNIIENTWMGNISKKYKESSIGDIDGEPVLRNVLVIENK